MRECKITYVGTLDSPKRAKLYNAEQHMTPRHDLEHRAQYSALTEVRQYTGGTFKVRNDRYSLFDGGHHIAFWRCRNIIATSTPEHRVQRDTGTTPFLERQQRLNQTLTPQLVRCRTLICANGAEQADGRGTWVNDGCAPDGVEHEQNAAGCSASRGTFQV